MTDYVWKQVCTEAGNLSQSAGGNKQAHIRQVAKALCTRIYLEVRKREATPAPSQGTCYSITVVNAVQSWVEAHYTGLSYPKSHKKSISQLAWEAAQGISLNHQVGGLTRQAAYSTVAKYNPSNMTNLQRYIEAASKYKDSRWASINMSNKADLLTLDELITAIPEE